MATDFRTIPSIATGNTLQTRNIFANFSNSQIQYLPSLAQIDGSLSRDPGATPVDLLRAGVILGKITTGGKYRPSIIGLTTGNYTSGGTSLTVAAPVATEVARLIALAGTSISLKLIGPPTTAGTLATTSATASAASGTTITIADAGVDKVLGTAICPADGSQIPVTVIPDQTGIDVVDTAGNSINQGLRLFLRGADLIASQIVNLTEGDASLQTWIKQQLNGGGTSTKGLFTFDNDR